MDMSVVKELKDSDELIDIETHFKLYAGPGAGKTRFLVNHVNNILRNSKRMGITRKVACITYTNAGVNAIVERLEATIDHVEVTTIHSFLYKNVLKPYAWILKDEFDIPINLLDGHDNIIPRYSIMAEWKSNTQQNYINDIDQLSKELSSLRWTMEDDKSINLKLKYPSKLKMKKSSYLEYKKLCCEKALLSHDDVLFFAYKILNKNDRITKVIRAMFPYILVDEFQDTSPIQAEILRLIGESETVVGVIGDIAQSIYSFQGAVPQKFSQFALSNLCHFKIENNHRSTKKVVDILNYIRNDDEFSQVSLREDQEGYSPTIIVGEPLKALKKAKTITKDDVYTLTFRNDNAYNMKTSQSVDLQTVEISELFSNDSNGDRRWIIGFTIIAIENARVSNFKDAIKYMKKAYRKNKSFTSRDALANLKRLMNCYSDYQELSIKQFYNDFLFGYYDVKSKVTKGKASTYYNNLKYQSLATGLGLSDEHAFYKTIHKAKGEEYDNVFIMIPESDENKALDFILQRDLYNNESHRVFYVACSRAKKNLYINVPRLSKKTETILRTIGFDIVRIDESS